MSERHQRADARRQTSDVRRVPALVWRVARSATGPAADDCRLTTAQSGFTLAGLLVVLTVLAVILAFTVPTKWSEVRKRERDRQLMFVMEQYARGIQEFQRRTGGLPTSLDQLGEFNNPRVLRQLYPNPLSGEVDWILVPPGTQGGPGAPGQANPNQQQPGQPQQPGSPQTGQPQQPGQQGGRGGDYLGPFIGVRPPQSGDSILEFRGAKTYEEWQFTIQDLEQEQNPQQQNPQQQQPQQPGGN